MSDQHNTADVVSVRDMLKRLDSNYEGLRKDFHEWKQGNHEDKKGMYKRLSSLEEKALFIPSQEEAELIREASAFYKAKREFRERLYATLAEKGITGVVLFVLAATFFYVKHLILGDA